MIPNDTHWQTWAVFSDWLEEKGLPQPEEPKTTHSDWNYESYYSGGGVGSDSVGGGGGIGVGGGGIGVVGGVGGVGGIGVVGGVSVVGS